MPDVANLEGPSLAPAGGRRARQLVILLHGLGADGDDLVGLAPHWAKLLPEAHFVAPHAPFRCDMAPMGRQWFSLQDARPQARLLGARQAAPIVDAFIDVELARHGLADDALALVGFSQGTMVSLHVALRRPRPCAAVLGYSGMLVGGDILADEMRSRPPVMLIHGDADPVVPVQALHAAEADLKAASVAVATTIRPGLGHGIDPDGLMLGGVFLKSHFALDGQ